MAATKKSQAQAAAKKGSSSKPGQVWNGVAVVTAYVDGEPTVVFRGEPNLFAQPHQDVRIELKVG